jgi:dihydroorotate dehydrogenase (NAD+) catalytic subunit
VVEFLIAGATAVQVGTATFIEAGIMERLIADLRAWMQAHGVSSVADLVGSVRDQEAGDGMLLAEGVS